MIKIKDLSLTCFSVIVSTVVLVLFNIPFFKFVAGHSEGDSHIIIISLILLMLVANFFATYLFCFLMRGFGKVLTALSFFLNAICIYFINVYNVMMDESMLGNVFNTRYSEASGFISWGLIGTVLVLGVIPCILIFKTKINWGTWKQFWIRIGVSLAVIITIVLLNMGNFLWIGKYDSELGGLLMPWSYTVNTARHIIIKHQENRQEILLPDASITDDEKAVFVLVIGESARAANFSLYGYGRQTNPRLSTIDSLHIFKAKSCATYTTAAVQGILEHEDTGKLYEILPNYLFRTGVDVFWRTANWGEPPLHIDNYISDEQLKAVSSSEDRDYDGILLEGLKEEILASGRNKILAVLHTSTSHGPAYGTKYPPRFEVFKPVCTTVETADKDIEGLINAYDNTIIYTDYLLSSLIDTLRTLPPSYHTSMLFVSDHGESLGENDLFMHGVPMAIAPPQQYEIPFMVWTSDPWRLLKQTEEADQHQVFHSVLNWLSIDSPVYDPKKSIFE
ncbi:MAG: phosphoethanolamine--lipid A transferase EptA [Alistipes sp.]|nr:phosphoethanolamine--lipid A transferase EptA [Candidatus Minthomonas equi]